MSEDVMQERRCKTPSQRSKSGKSDRTGGKWVVQQTHPSSRFKQSI